MFKLDTIATTAALVCITATIGNEVKKYSEIKSLKERTVVTRSEIQDLDKCYDRRRVLITASLLTAATAVVTKIMKNRKK